MLRFVSVTSTSDDFFFFNMNDDGLIFLVSFTHKHNTGFSYPCKSDQLLKGCLVYLVVKLFHIMETV